MSSKKQIPLPHVKELPRTREERRRARHAKWQGEWSRAHQEQTLLTAAKVRAKKAGVPCTITIDDVVIPPFCPYLGIPIARQEGRVAAGSPTLDRIRPELGYVPGNVEVISFRANTLKSDATADELEAIARRLRKLVSP